MNYNPKIVFVNGTFDILHPGHIMLLEHACRLARGGQVHVAIDSDKRVSKLKGPDRPFFKIAERWVMLSALKFVNRLYVFYSDEELESIIKTINPDIMVVGSDWKDKEVIGSQYAKRLEFFDRFEDYSTTKIIQHLTDR